jgi:aminoglycoside phosphotransferase (APT) family kinase protein
MDPSEVDTQELMERLAPVAVRDIRPLAGGASSLTYIGTIGGEGGRQVVLKVAPPGVAPVLNRDVLRQARLMRALHPTAVPVPEVIWEDPGDPPRVPPLFVMSFLEGGSLEPLFDAGGEEEATLMAERARNAARTLAALHALDPDQLGLSGEPLVGPADEIDRWSRLLNTVDPALVPAWPEVAAALHAAAPLAVAGSIVHGDFRLGNLLSTGARVVGVVDWEIWSVGDARVDVGWFLLNSDPATYRRSTRYAGSLPTPDDLTDVYVRAIGRDVPDLGWFRALACFKSSATWSLIVKHNRRRSIPDPGIEEMVATLPDLLEQARRLLS